MIDYLVALPVFIAVIVFGALIVVANERQKRELARIRKVEEQWAEQDLRIKRGKLARETNIEEPVAWLSAATSKALSLPVTLSAKEVLTNPDAVAFVDSESGHKFIFTLLSPDNIRQLVKKHKSSKAVRLNAAHPLLPIRRGTEIVELNMLNGGLLLDLELPHAWHTLTGQDTTTERLWMYIS
jgi:hypothetical protein